MDFFFQVSKLQFSHLKIKIAQIYWATPLHWLNFNYEPRLHERQQVMEQQSYISISLAYLINPSSSQEYQPRHDNITPSKTVRQIYRDKEQPEQKETSQNKSILQLSRRQFQQQSRCMSLSSKEKRKTVPRSQIKISFKKRPIHFHTNSTALIRPVKQNKFSFSSMETNKPPLSAQSFSYT